VPNRQAFYRKRWVALAVAYCTVFLMYEEELYN